jgi:hypothetical protein
MNGGNETFRARFCARLNRPEADFETLALKMFMHRPWSWCTSWLVRGCPKLILTDLQIIQQLGLVSNGSNFAAEVRGIHSDYSRRNDFGMLRRWFRLRLSRERIFKVSRDVWAK